MRDDLRWYTVIDTATKRVVQQCRLTQETREAHDFGDGVIVVETPGNAKFDDNTLTVDAGTGAFVELPPEPITKQQVNDEAQRRILSRFPVLDQLTAMRRGGPSLNTMGVFIDAVIAASNALTAKPAIPADFGDDKYWPAASAVASSQTASSLKGNSP